MIKAGGAHHSVLSYDVTAEMMKDWAEMMGIEFYISVKIQQLKILKKKFSERYCL